MPRQTKGPIKTNDMSFMSWVKPQCEVIHKIMDQVGCGNTLWEGQGGVQRCGTIPHLHALPIVKQRRGLFEYL
jgi:hypothetical protein